MSTRNALAHVANTDVLKTLHEMDKCLKPGGYLYFDSRNWEKSLQDTARFQIGQPFYRGDDVRIGYVQEWEYHADGTVTINILQSYEKDGRIFDTKEFGEHLHPFSLGLVKAELGKMGYTQIEVRPFPWFEDRNFEEIGWYCLLAKSPAIKSSNIVGRLLRDFNLSSTRERFAFALSFFIHVPDGAAPAVVCTLESFSIREQFLLCHACQPPFVNNTTYHTLC